MTTTQTIAALIVTAVAAAYVAGTGTWSKRSAAPERAARDFSKPSGPAHIESTLALPGGAAQAHVIAVPSEYGEVMRCVVGTTASGAISTACAPKSIEVISTDP